MYFLGHFFSISCFFITCFQPAQNNETWFYSGVVVANKKGRLDGAWKIERCIKPSLQSLLPATVAQPHPYTRPQRPHYLLNIHAAPQNGFLMSNLPILSTHYAVTPMNHNPDWNLHTPTDKSCRLLKSSRMSCLDETSTHNVVHCCTPSLCW